MSALLDLTDDDLDALSPADVERLEAAARTEFRTTKRFTHAQWDYMVESWNDLHPDERRARHAYCARHRHDWVGLPIADCCVCRRCCAYKMVDPE